MEKEKKGITVKDILKNKYVQWKDVNKSIKYHYLSDKNNYEELFYDLGKMRCKPIKKGEWLVVKGGFDYTAEWFEEKGKSYDFFMEDVMDKDIGQYYSLELRVEGEDMPYGVSFIPWGKMVNYPIDLETFKHFKMVDIVAHFIWEITFYGPEEESIKIGTGLTKTIKKLKKDIKKGTAKTKPLDEVKKKK